MKSSLVEADEATLATPIPAGAQHWYGTQVVVPSGQKWVQNYLIQPNFGEAADFSTGVSKVAGLPRRDASSQGPTERVGKHVDFGRQSPRERPSA